jgi:hypothetical protein
MEAIMQSRCPDLVIGTLSLIAVSLLAGHAQSEEFQCRRGDLVRRIELRFADDADRLPCQVVYWKDQENPGEPRVPWRANSDLEFCIAKAREMVDGLQSSGWACDGAVPAQDAAAPPSQDAAELDAIEPSAGSSRESAAQATALPPANDASEIAPAEGSSRQAAAEATTPAPDHDAAGIAPSEGGSSRQAAAEATTPAPADDGNGAAASDRATLQAALDRDVRRLEELGGASSGRFKPEMTTLGDLDGDGVAEGAVLLSHRDDNGGASHHLLAYRFDGRTFRPVARLNLESYYQNVTSVALGEIADGGIELLLHTRRAGDPACCPSGRRNATFELRDGEFVLVAESDSGA